MLGFVQCFDKNTGKGKFLPNHRSRQEGFFEILWLCTFLKELAPESFLNLHRLQDWVSGESPHFKIL